jgi:hypothetical protein
MDLHADSRNTVVWRTVKQISLDQNETSAPLAAAYWRASDIARSRFVLYKIDRLTPALARLYVEEQNVLVPLSGRKISIGRDDPDGL